MEKIKGTVDRIIFHSADNGFSIFVLTINKQTSAMIKGYLPSVNPGEEVCVEGSWIFHKKFGKQFHATACIIQVPTTIIGLEKYLGSGLIKGIGPVYGKKIVNHFGISTLEIIEKNPERLIEVPGVGKKRIEQIIEGYKDQKEIANLMVFLQEKDVSPIFAAKIYKAYGNNAISILHENPYRLADDIWGVGFKTADKIAQKLGFDPLSIKRIEAAINFGIAQTSKQGSLYIEIQKLKKAVIDLIELPEDHHDKVKTALHNLHEQQKIKVLSKNNEHFVTLTQFYHTEKNVAKLTQQLMESRSFLEFDINKIYEELRVPSDNDVHLHENQQRGIIAALTNKITVITGGPGTGKTTLIKKLLGFFDQSGYRYKLAAPTGRAAKRMMEGTGRHAVTLHRLLEFDASTMSFKNNEQNSLKLDVLIVDEASMIDIFLANSLLKAMPMPAHLILLGDVDQLPSVGAGNVLNDFIDSEKTACVRLTHIFRQAQDSLIIVNAHRVNSGEFPVSFLEGAKRDFKFIKEEDVERVPENLKSIFSQTLKKHNIPPEDAIVLAPMHRGAVGTQTFNHYLQKLLNPKESSSKEFIYAGTKYQEGDRVMQIRNNYDKGVFNGDIGTINEISSAKKNLIINYDGRSIEYDINELDELVLAYAISIHKSQGSEFSAAIIPLFMHHFTLLQRNLIYTAITRAKKLCILIGQPKAIAMAINNNKSSKRTTFLKDFLTTNLEAR